MHVTDKCQGIDFTQIATETQRESLPTPPRGIKIRIFLFTNKTLSDLWFECWDLFYNVEKGRWAFKLDPTHTKAESSQEEGGLDGWGGGGEMFPAEQRRGWRAVSWSQSVGEARFCPTRTASREFHNQLDSWNINLSCQNSAVEKIFLGEVLLEGWPPYFSTSMVELPAEHILEENIGSVALRNLKQCNKLNP